MTVCDYAGYDYKKAFWENQGREYEDTCERRMLVTLLSSLSPRPRTLMDIGCGFGRLFRTYEPFAGQFVLFDYAQHLLDQAKAEIKSEKPIRFVQGNMMDMPFSDGEIDAAISVRTLHHLSELGVFFSQVSRVLSTGGAFVFEIPNQRHVLNIFRAALGRIQNPFSLKPLKVGSFLNYHPKKVFQELEKAGFQVVRTQSTSFFRSAFIKKRIEASTLNKWDERLGRLFSWVYLTPSLYVVAKKVK